MQADALHPSGAVWWPDRSTVENANLTRFMHALGVDSFEALNERASADPAGFNEALIRFLDYRFEQPYEQVLSLSEGLPFAHWCVGGTTNVVLNCIDRRRGTPRYTQEALVWEGEDGSITRWTFADLDRETCRLAWGRATWWACTCPTCRRPRPPCWTWTRSSASWCACFRASAQTRLPSA
jgi:acetyl-CoA synthetase